MLKKGITAHCVVKNEERWIWFSVKSVIDYVDKVLIYDTGSSDKTVEIIKYLQDEYKDKIVFKQFNNVTDESFYKLRQEQIDKTDTDWFLVLDGDEIWYEQSIKELVEIIENNECDMVATRFYNCVGDVYHLKNYNAEHYKIKNETGSITIRAYSKNIKGIHCSNNYGVEGFFDSDDNPVQNNINGIVIQQGYYFHMSYVLRTTLRSTFKLSYRKKKLLSKWDLKVEKDFKFPDVFYSKRPGFVRDPFKRMPLIIRIISALIGIK